MARPLSVSKAEPLPSQEPDVVSMVIQTLGISKRLDTKAQRQHKAIEHLASEIGGLKSRMDDANRRLDEVLALLREERGSHHNVDPHGATVPGVHSNGNGADHA